ncbi:hypothetical protein [Rathayibacter soli]|uniref:hypothetical protein n=1 Tax=Rathayibacter soli TaxID=3144168 RepID=UPI0027E55CF9|nr:hypothetical protein [Glaciibacter superstes]
MTAPSPVAAPRDRYWLVPLGRAIAALIAGAVITFSANHSARLGLTVFGAFAVVAGLVVGVGALLLADRVVRPLFLAQGVFGIAAGALSLALGIGGGGLGVFLFVVSVWAALTGFSELYAALRIRGRLAAGRDWLVVGAMTAVLAVVFLLIPADAVLAVGLFGAYAVVIGVYLAIGAFSLKWGTAQPQSVSTRSVSTQSANTQAPSTQAASTETDA